MNEGKRMAGDYEIIHDMCAYCESNVLFERFDDVMVSDDYPEIISMFGQRVAQQADKTSAEMVAPALLGIHNAPLTAKRTVCLFLRQMTCTTR